MHDTVRVLRVGIVFLPTRGVKAAPSDTIQLGIQDMDIILVLCLMIHAPHERLSRLAAVRFDDRRYNPTP